MNIPQALWPLVDVVERSRWILKLAPDWDGQGSPGYEESTFQRGVTFLLKNAMNLWDRYQIVVETPQVHNGPMGSIDICWDSPTGKLLINIPPGDGAMVSFYGKNVAGNEIKGTFYPEADNLWLLLWQSRS